MTTAPLNAQLTGEQAELKPCPFCGAELMHRPEISQTYHPKHQDCPARNFSFCTDRKDVVAAWNRRALAKSALSAEAPVASLYTDGAGRRYCSVDVIPDWEPLYLRPVLAAPQAVGERVSVPRLLITEIRDYLHQQDHESAADNPECHGCQFAEELTDLLDTPKAADGVAEEGYLTSPCTENNCKLCRTPIHARRAGMLHAGISIYTPPNDIVAASPAAGNQEAMTFDAWFDSMVPEWARQGIRRDMPARSQLREAWEAALRSAAGNQSSTSVSQQPNDDWFRVEVSDGAGQVVAIEPEMLAGRTIGDTEELKIRKAIAHFQGFVGAGNQDTVAQGDVAQTLKEISTHLYSAKVQRAASDDRIIAGCIDKAFELTGNAMVMVALYGTTQAAIDAEVGRKWRENSSLEEWFPITAEHVVRLERELSALRSPPSGRR